MSNTLPYEATFSCDMAFRKPIMDLNVYSIKEKSSFLVFEHVLFMTSSEICV